MNCEKKPAPPSAKQRGSEVSISCEHGLLRRQCALCDAIQENSELRARIAELEAQQRAGVPEFITVSMASHSKYAEGWNDCRAAMLTAPAPKAKERAGVPEGWKLVPVEITEAMKSAGMDVLMNQTDIYADDYGNVTVETITPRRIYTAMLAAAPSPEGQEQAPQPAEGGAILERAWYHKMDDGDYEIFGDKDATCGKCIEVAIVPVTALTAAGRWEEWANQAVEAMQRVRFAMEMNNWNWKSEASNDLKREAYQLIVDAIAATQPAQEKPE